MSILIKDPLIKDESLNWTERVLLAYIEGFRKKGGCDSKNQTIAEVLRINDKTVRNILSSLSKRELIIISYVGKKRCLFVNKYFDKDTTKTKKTTHE